MAINPFTMEAMGEASTHIKDAQKLSNHELLMESMLATHEKIEKQSKQRLLPADRIGLPFAVTPMKCSRAFQKWNRYD